MTFHETVDSAVSHMLTVKHLLTESEDPDMFTLLSDLAYIVRWGKFVVRETMQHAIDDGATYQDVADALGVSRQSAWEALNPRGGKGPCTDLDQLKLF